MNYSHRTTNYAFMIFKTLITILSMYNKALVASLAFNISRAAPSVCSRNDLEASVSVVLKLSEELPSKQVEQKIDVKKKKTCC